MKKTKVKLTKKAISKATSNFEKRKTKKTNKECIIPFEYEGKKFFDCTDINDDSIRMCPTKEKNNKYSGFEECDLPEKQVSDLLDEYDWSPTIIKNYVFVKGSANKKLHPELVNEKFDYVKLEEALKRAEKDPKVLGILYNPNKKTVNKYGLYITNKMEKYTGDDKTFEIYLKKNVEPIMIEKKDKK